MAPDLNNNGIPDRIDLRIVAILSILTAAGQAAEAYVAQLPDYYVPLWAHLLLVALPVLAGYFAVYGRPGGTPPVTVILLGLGLAVGASGCKTTDPTLADCYRTVSVMAKVRVLAGDTMATTCNAERAKCNAQDDPAARLKCLQESPCKAALQAMTMYVKPALQTSERTTWGVCETIRESKDPNATWADKAKPGICSASISLTKWKALLGDQAKTILGLLGGIAGVFCEE